MEPSWAAAAAAAWEATLRRRVGGGGKTTFWDLNKSVWWQRQPPTLTSAKGHSSA